MNTESSLILNKWTPARVGLGRAGLAIPMRHQLDFKRAHAAARDAVYAELDLTNWKDRLIRMDQPFFHVPSIAVDRTEYLKRPDRGRKPDPLLLELIQKQTDPQGYDVSIQIADGLSPAAVNRYGPELLTAIVEKLSSAGLRLSPSVLITQGRVAISDSIGQALGAKQVVLLIGERPGLSSTESLAAYLTPDPKPGNTDAMRTCISNIGAGLSIAAATDRICDQILSKR